MLLLIVAGLVYVILTESIAVAVVVASLVLYRAQRPGRFGQRLREAWYQREAARVGADEEDVRGS